MPLTRDEFWLWLHNHLRSGVWHYPCSSCGDVHNGEYGIYDWAHCNCPHEGERWEGTDPGDAVLCSDCGDVLT